MPALGRYATVARTSLTDHNRSAGVVGDAEASEWLDAIDRAVARRRYFFSVTQFVVWGDVS
jgi:hypothetical protein